MLTALFGISFQSALTTGLIMAVFALVIRQFMGQPWQTIFHPANCKLWFIVKCVFALMSFFSAPLVALADLAGSAVMLFVIAPQIYKRS